MPNSLLEEIEIQATRITGEWPSTSKKFDNLPVQPNACIVRTSKSDEIKNPGFRFALRKICGEQAIVILTYEGDILTGIVNLEQWDKESSFRLK